MAEDLGVQEPDNYSKRKQNIVHRKEVTKERGAQRVHSLTVQNEMTIVLSRMTAGSELLVLPVLGRQQFNKKLCPLQLKREKTQQA